MMHATLRHTLPRSTPLTPTILLALTPFAAGGLFGGPTDPSTVLHAGFAGGAVDILLGLAAVGHAPLSKALQRATAWALCTPR